MSEPDPAQVDKYLESAKHIAENSKDKELAQKAEQVFKEIKEEDKVEEHIKLQKYQCLKCKEVFPTERSFKGHYHGKPRCGMTPRYMTDYDKPEDQMKVIRI